MPSRLALILLVMTIVSPSTGAQESWTDLGPWGASVEHLLSTDDGTMYALEGHNNLFRLGAGSDRWEPIPAWGDISARTIHTFRGVLLAFSDWDKMWYSTDRGESWNLGATVDYTGGFDRSTVASVGDSLYFTGSSLNRVMYLSTDSRRTWNAYDTLAERSRLRSDGRRLFAYGLTGGVWKHDGEEWSDISPDAKPCEDLLVEGDTLICVSESGSYHRSFNRGSSWDSLSIASMAATTIHDGHLWGVSYAGEGIFSMPFAGTEWEQILAFENSYHRITGLHFAGDTLYLASAIGVHRNVPGSLILEPISKGMNTQYIAAITPFRDTLFVDAAGVNLTPLLNVSWERRPDFPVDVSVIDGDYIYGYRYQGRQLFRSTDRGRTSEPIGPEVLSSDIIELYADGGVLFVAGSSEVVRSLDSGESWTLMEAMDGLREIFGRDDTVFMNSGATGAAFQYSVDAGKTWDTIMRGALPPPLGLSPARAYGDRHLFVGTIEDGLLHSTDFGRSWRRVDPWERISADDRRVLIEHVLVVDEVVVMAVRPRRLPGARRIFLSTDWGDTWRELPHPPGVVQRMAFDGTRIFASQEIGFVRMLEIDYSITDVHETIEMVGTGLNADGEGRLRWHSGEIRPYRIDVYSISGKRVLPTVEGMTMVGTNTSDADLSELPAGLYFCVLRVDSQVFDQFPLLIRR